MKNQSATVNLDLRMLELRQEIWDTAQELRHAYDRFDFVTDPALIEAGIYDINAMKSRYDFLLRKLKAMQGLAVRPEASAPPRTEPACMPAGNMNGGKSCPS